MLYLICKVLYFLNIITQLFVMNRILGSDYYIYGFTVVSDLLGTGDWRRSERFPRTTICDLKVRRLGNLQRYTVQCVLGVNLFNEMIFLIIWWWFFLVMVYTFYTMIMWILCLFSKSSDRKFIKKYIEYRDTVPQDNELEVCTNVPLNMFNNTFFIIISIFHLITAILE